MLSSGNVQGPTAIGARLRQRSRPAGSGGAGRRAAGRGGLGPRRPPSPPPRPARCWTARSRRWPRRPAGRSSSRTRPARTASTGCRPRSWWRRSSSTATRPPTAAAGCWSAAAGRAGPGATAARAAWRRCAPPRPAPVPSPRPPCRRPPCRACSAAAGWTPSPTASGCAGPPTPPAPPTRRCGSRPPTGPNWTWSIGGGVLFSSISVDGTNYAGGNTQSWARSGDQNFLRMTTNEQANHNYKMGLALRQQDRRPEQRHQLPVAVHHREVGAAVHPGVPAAEADHRRLLRRSRPRACRPARCGRWPPRPPRRTPRGASPASPARPAS